MNAIKAFVSQHPRLASFIVLSVGMVALLLWAARDAPLSGGQLGGLVLACIALAGACTWIISWE